MKRILTLVLVMLFLVIESNAQSKQNSMLYDLINGNEYGAKLLLDEKGYFLLTNGICDPGTGNSKGCTSILTLDKEWEVLKFHTFVNWFRFASTRALQKENDTIVVFGVDLTITPSIWNVYRTNFNIDSLDLRRFDVASESRIPVEAFQIKGEYLYLLGRTYIPGKKEIVVLKIDKEGKKIKENRFYDIAEPKNNNTSYDMVKTSDGNFVLSGRLIRKHGHRKIQSFIIKFDDNLDTIWVKKFNSVSLISNEPYLTASHDGSIVVSWGLYTPDMGDEFKKNYRSYEQYPSILYNVDKDGNIVWADILWAKLSKGNVGPKKRILKMITASNGDIVGCGYYEDNTQRRTWGYMFRYNSKGKKLWEKKYEDTKYPLSRSVFYDLQEAENGDIVSTGNMNTKEGWGNNNNYIWLLRVDSMGCFTQGCESIIPRRDTVQTIDVVSSITVGTNDLIKEYSNFEGIKIYPNPSSQFVKIDILNGYVSEELDIVIYDMLGNALKNMRIKRNEKIDISSLNKGIYFLEVKDLGQKLGIGKFIVE